ncbi:coiled-coil domain-containing protein 18 isoform A [Patagioenas fasciata monilis]|uniref:Coiled-coil domain-containing protein 18 isoform A n=1 Tax=Patagioenas fasciata monilis TaxID=372326 RepID=A0A1V4JYQ8_PATFA|nr:coiled-coil domain-containing protein 18 isoform A [Patagioenas fasciata monilis]
MEYSMWTCSKSVAAEDLLANLQSLQNQLRRTEKDLQTVEEELSSTSTSEHYGHCFGEAVDLTLEDLAQPNCSYQGISNCKKNAGKTSCQDFQRKSKFYSVSTNPDKIVEENECLKEKLNALHQQNAYLTSQNCYLKNRVETVNVELMQSKTRIAYLESTVGTHLVSIPKLKEQIINLEAEVSAQDKILRDAEDKLDQSRKIEMEKENILQRYKKDYKNLKIELIERSKQGKRAEQQRNEALLNAEELTRAFKKFKEKATEKLEKVKAEEVLLRKRLINCEKEKDKLNEKCVSYRKDLESLEEQLRQLKEENHSTKEEIRTLEAKNTEMVSMLTWSDKKIIELESELGEKEIVLKEKNALISENAELKALTAQQHNCLKLCHQEIEDSREERNILETIISQLSQSTSEEFKWHHLKHQLSSSSTEAALSESCESSIKLAMKEAEIQKPRANLTVCNGAENLSNNNEGQENSGLCDLEADLVKLIRSQGERRNCQQLELISKQFERERQRFQKEIEELHTKLTKADDENSSLKTSMAQRASQFQIIQEDLLKKASKTSSLEREITKKSSQLSALEKQLEEKTIAYSAAAARNTELEQELMGKNRRIHELETTISEEHKQITSAFEKEKLVHLEQHKEMEKQIEMLQTQLEKKHQQFIEQEKIISILQQDVIHKQHHIESLDRLLMESREKMENQNIKKDQGLKVLKSQLTEERLKVGQLESALDMCKEEVALYLCQSQENKEIFENQLKKKSEEVHYLQKEIKLKDQNIQGTSEQNIRLQQTLHHQQQMLQQETIRNGELEDIQIKLEKQVSHLEQELQKQKAYGEDELRKTEEKLRLAAQEADVNRQKVDELNGTIRQIKLEMNQCKNELTGVEKEVTQLKQDCEDKAMQINQLDITLEEARSELNEKANKVNDLEDRLLQSETCHREALQKTAELESALQNARGELKVVLTQLQELQDALQNAQSSLEEKHVAIRDLTTELRYCKGEIEDKNQELLDMDQALKERNWELKQRAAQITQLDMTVREHRGEMEQQIIRLECNLEKSELEIKECNKQIQILEKKLQHSKDELREKDKTAMQSFTSGNCCFWCVAVYATMRNLAKKEPLEEAAGHRLGKTLEIKQLDVCDEQSIKTCVNSIPDRRIDVLVSNAGMGLIGPIECQTIEEMKTVMDTNFFGLVRLLKEILPDMKRRKSGHIVIISSVMGIQGILFNDVYAASKFAVEGFCESLAIQALKFKLQLSLIEPGPVVTEFERKVFEDGMKMDLSAADEETAEMFTNIYLKNYKQIFQSLGQSAEDVAEHTVKIILADNPPFRHQTNTLYTPMTTLKYADPNGDLPIDIFYKMVFHHDKIFSASLNFIKLLRWRSRKSFDLGKPSQ